jgi:AraC family transcriptional regulator of adaptative response / DNA-3-methyladenine glycosylase II
MRLDRESCQRARIARDPRFDGSFFTAVKTTRIYCRSICPAPSPKEENVVYYPSAAAAAEAGYRPCLRCRPEASPGAPAWQGTAVTVTRALRLMGESPLDHGGVEHLADRLGVGSRHLRRLFIEHLGAPPVAVAQTRKLHFAKKLIDETSLTFTEVAMAAGFGSIRRFNFAFQQLYGRTPTELRRLAGKRSTSTEGSYRFRLPFRPPYDGDAILGFLASRSIPGVESVTGNSYRRTIGLNGSTGEIEVRLGGDALDVRIQFPDARQLFIIVERVRRIFDLSADPGRITSHLERDPLLAPKVARRSGLRLPGAWDPFELAVRAILGQQVSVKGASTLAGRMAAEYGHAGLFPTPEALVNAPIEECGIIRSRAATIRALAAAGLQWDHIGNSDAFLEQLLALPGIGPWTAQYIAMRALGEPDAFPAGDMVLQRAAGCRTARELEQRAEAWRPWRAYAAIHLWQGENDEASLH